MKINQTRFYILFFSFAILSTLSIIIPEKGFNEFDLPPGETKLSYIFPLDISYEDGKSPFISFSFSADKITFTIEENPEIISEESTKDKWNSIPLTKLTELLSNNFTLVINNKNQETAKMIFIDNTKEIKINIGKFLSWKYEIEVKKEDFTPTPLIFSLDEFKNEILINVRNQNDYEIYNDTNLIYYCVNNNLGCQYLTVSALLKLKKNKNYKFKLNCIQRNNNYYFSLPEFSKISFEEYTSYGPSTELYFEDDINTNYYLLYTKDINEVSIFIKYEIDNYYYAFINENIKENINDEFNNIVFEENTCNVITQCSNENNDEYMIIKIERDDNADLSEASINIFDNEVYIDKPTSLVIPKGKHTLISILITDKNHKYNLVSNSILCFFDSEFNQEDLSEIKIIEPRILLFAYPLDEDANIQIDVSIINEEDEEEEHKEEEHKEEETKEEEEYVWKIDVIDNKKLNDFFKNIGQDSFFMRIFSDSIDFGYNFSYYFNLDEKYYLYNKKYFGEFELYQNMTNIDRNIENEDFNELIHSLGTSDSKLINNELITLSGSQLITHFNSYGSFYDMFIQKENDSDNIQESALYPNGFAKLLKENKIYTLNFKVNHYIKLDNQFLNAEVTFTIENEIKDQLNNDKKVIKDLTGDNIKVKSNKNALIYFYKKIEDPNKIKVIEFDKNKPHQNMKFNIIHSNIKEKIMISKDFGFKECYPLLYNNSFDIVYLSGNESTIYIENLYDKLLTNDLYEEEQFLIYIFNDFENNLPIFKNDNNIEITQPVYYTNILTEGNKYNFEVIHGISDSSIILSVSNKKKAIYQFNSCSSKSINFNVKNSNGDINVQDTINGNPTKNIDLKNKNQILEHTFESDQEFFFLYSLMNNKIETCNTNENHVREFSAIEFPKNRIQVEFSQKNLNCLNKYYIIIAKSDYTNSISSFSNYCQIGKMMATNSNSIIVKTIIEKSEKENILASVDINKLNHKENDKIVINIINYNILSNNEFFLYRAIEYQFSTFNEIIEFNLEEKVKFDFDKRSQFKFNYEHKGDMPLKIDFIIDSAYTFKLMFGDEENIKNYNINAYDNFVEVELKKSGTYYLKFHSKSNEHDGEESDNYFSVFIPNKVIDTINFDQKSYYYNEQICVDSNLGPRIIKVENLNEDKYALFSYKVVEEYEEDDEENDYENPFEICKDNSEEECKKNIDLFSFSKGYNYTIKINFSRKNGYDNSYCNPTFAISQIYKDSIQKDKESGLNQFSDIQLYSFNLEKHRKLYLSVLNDKATFVAYSNKNIDLNELNTLKLQKINSKIEEIFGNNYGIVIIVPENNEIETKAVIADNFLSKNKVNEFNIGQNENAIIYIEEEEDEDDDKNKILFKEEEQAIPEEGEDYDDDLMEIDHFPLITFSSPEKNMELFTLNSTRQKSNLMIQNSYPIMIYVDKADKDISISIKSYEPKYAYALAINNNDLLIDYLEHKEKTLNTERNGLSLKDIMPLNMRINSDLNEFYDFINLYFSDIKEKIIIYIKKYYGGTELFECDVDLKEESDYSLLTKPISSCKNKKSLFNRIIKLEDIKLLSGYLGHNSYFDIYLDIERFSDSKAINPIPNFYIDMDFNNAARYLEKDVDYNLNLKGEYLAKLEPGFNAEVSIYDGNKLILMLNSSKLKGNFTGENLTIKSNNNAMVYFYSKLIEEGKQLEIDPNIKGKNYKFKIPREASYMIDFGFKGYNSADLFSLEKQQFEDDNDEYKTVYIENIYEKLTEKLIDDEKLYLYYFNSQKEATVEYTDTNINPPYNEYTFNSIQKSDSEKSLIINSLEIEEIQYQVIYCDVPQTIKMFYQSMHKTEESFKEFNDNQKLITDKLEEGTTKLRFESEEDFVFAYSFIDEFDEDKKDEKDRKEINNLAINSINKKENSSLYTINFNSNYRNSSTRYIVVVAPKNEKYTKETFSNPCFITKLVTEKSDEVKIINIYDIGENEFINVDVDLYSIPGSKDEFVIGIISQELRFDKKLNFYQSKEFIDENQRPTEITIEEKEEFDLSKDEPHFSLSIKDKSEYNEMLLLHYKLEQSGSFIIEIYLPDGNTKSFEINDDDGFINFLYDKNGGTYEIIFKKVETQLLRSTSENSIKGTFEILKSENSFDLDLTKDNIEFKEFNIDDANEPSLKFNFKPLDKDYTKKISISNYDFSNINTLVLINENNLGYKPMNFTYYTFEKNSEYNITIKFESKGKNSYTLEKVNILAVSPIEFKNIADGELQFSDNKDQFLIIDWKNLKSIVIHDQSEKTVLSKSDITNSQSNNLLKEFKNLRFTKVESEINKPNDKDYSVLMIEPEINTHLSFELKKDEKKESDKNDNKDDDDDDDNNVAIILIIVFSAIILIVAVIVILRYVKKRSQEIDFKKKAEDIQNETLLQDI